MASIAKLAVQLSVNSGKFSSGMRKAEKRFNGFRNSAAKVSRSLRRAAVSGKALLGVLSAAALGGGIAFVVKRQLELIDTTAKVADKFGIATESLVSLRLAAKLTGVEANTFDMALQRMARRVAEAGQGTGEAKDALKELGVNAKAISRLAPDKQFLAIAAAMSKVTNNGDKIRLAFKLFDSEGVALVNTLNLGVAGLEAVADEAERLGLTFSRIDAAQVVAANDAILLLKETMSGAARVAAIQLAPFIAAAAKKLKDMAIAGEGLGPKVIGSIESITLGVAKMGDAWDGAISKVKTFQAATITALADAQDFFTKLNERKSPMRQKVDRDVNRFADFLGIPDNRPKALADPAAFARNPELAARFKALREGAPALVTKAWRDTAAKLLDEVNKGVKKPSTKDKLVSFFTTLKEDAKKAANLVAGGPDKSIFDPAFSPEKLKELDKLKKEGAKIAESARTPFEKLRDELAKLRDLLQEGVISQDTFGRAANKAFDTYNESLDKANKGLKGQIDKVKALNRETGKFGTGRFQAFNMPFATPFAPFEGSGAQAAQSAARGTPQGGRQGTFNPQISLTNQLLTAIVGNAQQPNVAVFG